jgi:hypothetical protein
MSQDLSNYTLKPHSRRNSDSQTARCGKRLKSESHESTNTVTTENGQEITPTKRDPSSHENIPQKLSSNCRILPSEYIKCDKVDLITIISRMLSSIVSINDSRTSLDVKYLSSQHLTRFHSRSPPQISIYNYLRRLAHYSSLENCVLIATVYYIDLLTMQYPTFALNSLTVHRFLLTATTIASKALCDSFCSNNHYAKVGGVNITELNLLEGEFLKWVNYRVVPRDFNYDSICERKNSMGNIELNLSNALKFGIASADKILDLYYVKMIGLCGGFQNNEFTQIGSNDNLIYTLEEPLHAGMEVSYSSSSCTSTSSTVSRPGSIDSSAEKINGMHVKGDRNDASNGAGNGHSNSNGNGLIRPIVDKPASPSPAVPHPHPHP